MVLHVVATLLRIVIAIVFMGMGVTHFVPTIQRGMRAMIPPSFRGPRWPSTRVLVIGTGVCEIAGGIGLLIPWTRPIAGVALAVFLIAVFPANAYAARDPKRFGRVAFPLVPRLIAQIVLIVLVLFVAFD